MQDQGIIWLQNWMKIDFVIWNIKIGLKYSKCSGELESKVKNTKKTENRFLVHKIAILGALFCPIWLCKKNHHSLCVKDTKQSSRANLLNIVRKICTLGFSRIFNTQGVVIFFTEAGNFLTISGFPHITRCSSHICWFTCKIKVPK